MTTHVIETERLVLRPWGLDDVAALARLIGDIEVSRWLTVVPHPYSAADAESFIRDGDPLGRYCIELGGQVAGGISVRHHLGYWLGVRFWGQSYMSEAARAVVAYWFDGGGGDLESGYFVGNQASERILAGLGFQPGVVEATKSCATGEVKELQKMALGRADWRARHA